MDNLTHSLFGLTVARTPLGRVGRGSTVALLLASNAPDIDIVTTIGGAASYLQWHRGPTHGPLGIVSLGLVCALIARAVAGWRTSAAPDPPASIRSLWLVAMAGVACHVLMDLPTPYGTRLFSPFSWTWYAEDWMPIVDVYLLAILVAGLLLGRTRGLHSTPKLRMRQAYIALALMALNYGVRGYSHRLAVASAPNVFGPLLPLPCPDAAPAGRWIEAWPRPTTLTPRDAAARTCLVDMAAVPDFFSPFKWQLIAHLPHAYERREVDLMDDRSRSGGNVMRQSVRYPNQWTPAVGRAAQSDVGRIFLGFARFPAARSATDTQGVTTVRWTDMRFAMNRLGTSERDTGIFSATIRLGADGSVTEQRLGP